MSTSDPKQPAPQPEAALLSLDDDTPLARPEVATECSLEPGCESCQ